MISGCRVKVICSTVPWGATEDSGPLYPAPSLSCCRPNTNRTPALFLSKKPSEKKVFKHLLTWPNKHIFCRGRESIEKVTKFNFFLFLFLLQSGRPGILNQTDPIYIHTIDNFPSLLECSFWVWKKMNLTALFSHVKGKTPAGNKLVKQQVSNIMKRNIPHHRKIVHPILLQAATQPLSTGFSRIIHWLVSFLYMCIIYNSLLYSVYYNLLIQTL